MQVKLNSMQDSSKNNIKSQSDIGNIIWGNILNKIQYSSYLNVSNEPIDRVWVSLRVEIINNVYESVSSNVRRFVEKEL
jgi:hypothetical protein